MNLSNIRTGWIRIQNELRQRLVLEENESWSLDPTSPTELRLVGGVDVSFLDPSEDSAKKEAAVACLVVLSFPSLEVVYEDFEYTELEIPYITGFLAFREAPCFQELIRRVSLTEFNPQVILVDGNGTLHPRRFGSACHLGVISDYPTIGVAKNLYCIEGLDERAIKESLRRELERTSASSDVRMELKDREGCVIGVAMCNHGMQESKNPVYVSPGHRVSMRQSVDIAKACSLFRIPEPVRQADLRSRGYVKTLADY